MIFSFFLSVFGDASSRSAYCLGGDSIETLKTRWSSGLPLFRPISKERNGRIFISMTSPKALYLMWFQE